MFRDVRDIRQVIMVIYFGDKCNKFLPVQAINIYKWQELNVETGWRWDVGFTPRLLYPQERALDTHRIEGWKVPIIGLDV